MKKLIYLFIILIILSTTACRKDLEDIKLNDVYFDFDAKAVADPYDEEMNQEPNLFDVVGVVSGKGYFNDKY